MPVVQQIEKENAPYAFVLCHCTLRMMLKPYNAARIALLRGRWCKIAPRALTSSVLNDHKQRFESGYLLLRFSLLP